MPGVITENIEADQASMGLAGFVCWAGYKMVKGKEPGVMVRFYCVSIGQMATRII